MMDGQVLVSIAALGALGIGAYRHLLDEIARAIHETVQLVREIADLRAEHARGMAILDAHETALNGGMTERIRGVVAQQLVEAAIQAPRAPASDLALARAARIVAIEAALVRLRAGEVGHDSGHVGSR